MVWPEKESKKSLASHLPSNFEVACCAWVARVTKILSPLLNGRSWRIFVSSVPALFLRCVFQALVHFPALLLFRYVIQCDPLSSSHPFQGILLPLAPSDSPF